MARQIHGEFFRSSVEEHDKIIARTNPWFDPSAARARDSQEQRRDIP
jgi:hypothetical protein